MMERFKWKGEYFFIYDEALLTYIIAIVADRFTLCHQQTPCFRNNYRIVLQSVRRWQITFFEGQWLFLPTWLNFNPSMDK